MTGYINMNSHLLRLPAHFFSLPALAPYITANAVLGLQFGIKMILRKSHVSCIALLHVANVSSLQQTLLSLSSSLPSRVAAGCPSVTD